MAEVPAARVIVYRVYFWWNWILLEGTHDMASTMRVAGDVRAERIKGKVQQNASEGKVQDVTCASAKCS